MRNPLDSEETAFHYVLGTVAYFVPIAIAAWIATWLGVVVFAVMTIAAILVIRSGRKPEPPSEPPRPAAVEDTPEAPPPASDSED
jgi:membrane protein implicated in regulation of membrane protease activity